MTILQILKILFKVLKNGWQIISPKKSFAVYAATATEKAEWMAHINKCITDLLSKSKCQANSIKDLKIYDVPSLATF